MSDARYLDLVDGMNTGLWITSVKFEGADPKEKTPRKKIILNVCTLPTKESFTSPFTMCKIYVPNADEPVQTRIIMDDKIKRILFPMVGFQPGKNEDGSKKKISMKALCTMLKDQFDAYDYKVDIIAKITDGKSLDKNGNLMKFSDILDMKITGYEEKGVYEGDMEYDMEYDI
jgi:hypothetical protein